MTLVDNTDLKWHKQGTREAYDLQGLAADLVEWEPIPLFQENDDSTPYDRKRGLVQSSAHLSAKGSTNAASRSGQQQR